MGQGKNISGTLLFSGQRLQQMIPAVPGSLDTDFFVPSGIDASSFEDIRLNYFFNMLNLFDFEGSVKIKR